MPSFCQLRRRSYADFHCILMQMRRFFCIIYNIVAHNKENRIKHLETISAAVV